MKKIILLFAGLAFLTFKNQAQTVTDIDGNVYNTVTIGTQTWMKENLKVKHYRDSSAIPNITDVTTWSNLITGAYCDYNNMPSYSTTYGKLYNWYAATDIHNICPKGWHVPSDGEWNIMEKYLDSSVDTTAIGWVGTNIGNQLKESGTSHWASGNNGTNSSNFTALPGGFRYSDGSFFDINGSGYWWTTTASAASNAWFRVLDCSNAAVYSTNNGKVGGFSVRCACDSVVTQIDENSIDKHIQIYPNPANDNITIEILQVLQSQKSIISVYDLRGQLMLKLPTQQAKTVPIVIGINVSTLSKGIYILKIQNADGIMFKKFVKE